MTERVLPFDPRIIRQDTGYWCGPASAQMALSARSKFVDEATLARECGTTTDGTNSVSSIERVLDVRLPEARYTSTYRTTRGGDDRARCWWDIVRSIDNRFAVVANFVVPRGKGPRGVKGSASPSYNSPTTYHYVTVVGWSDEGNNGRPSVLIADSGFSPWTYWMDFEQFFSLLFNDDWKGYLAADLPLLAPPPPGVVLPPGIPVNGNAAAPVITPPPPPVSPKPTPATGKLTDPFTGAFWSPNKHKRRVAGNPRWIVWHTQEGGRSARDLAAFLADPDSEVSYHGVGDDREVLKCVAETDSPWAASGANDFAFHFCFAGAYVGWSRNKWLSPDASDGKNEDLQLTKGAHVGAWWSDKYGIPAEWIGRRNQPPWGLDGHCGHGDLAAWGGGHTDPYPNFPIDEFMRRITEILTGTPQEPLPVIPAVALPGTEPGNYSDWMLVAGDARNDPEKVKKAQQQLHRYSYGKAILVDGVFGEMTRLAIKQFQINVGLYPDGIVGPMTAAALFRP